LNRGRRTAAFDQVPSHKTDICSRNTSRPWYSNCAPWNPGDIQGLREYINFIIQIINKILIISLAFYFIFATRECIFTTLGLRKNPYSFTRFPQTLRDWRRLARYYTRKTLDFNRGYTDFSWFFSVSPRKIPGHYRN
jgi:hypothetical protein